MPKAAWKGLFALAPMVLLSGCVTYSTYSRPLDEGGPGLAYREGRIESVQEVVRRTVGDPAGGAIAGSLIGALVGQAIGGTGASALAGAIGGAATGAAVSSQGASEQREYVVHVRFDDGTLGRISYSSPPPWRFGDRVRQTAHGLERIGGAPPMPPQPSRPPPPPPAQLPPPPSGANMDSPP